MPATSKLPDPISRLLAGLLRASSDQQKLDAYLEFLNDPGDIKYGEMVKRAGDPFILIRSMMMKAKNAGARAKLKIQHVQGLFLRARLHARYMESSAANTALRDALNICRQEEQKELIEFLLPIGQMFVALDFDQNAEEAYKKAEELYSAHMPEKAAEAAEALGYLYSEREDYFKAIESHQRALDIRSKLERPDLDAASLSALARTYAAMADCANTGDDILRYVSEYHERCIAAVTACEKKGALALQVADAYQNLAVARLGLQEYGDAHNYVMRALFLYKRLYEKIRNNGTSRSREDCVMVRLGLARIQWTLGAILMQEKKYPEAATALAAAYRYADIPEGVRLLPLILLQAGRLHCLWQPMKDRAIQVLLDAEKHAREQGNRRVLLKVHKILAEEYERQGRRDDALYHYRELTRLHGELANEKLRRELRELESSFASKQAVHRELQLRQEQQKVVRLNNELKVNVVQLGVHKEFLEKVRGQLDTGLASLGEPGTSNVRKIFTELRKKVHIQYRSAADWKQLLARIRDVNPEVIRVLTELYPALTEAQRDVCALTLIGLTAQEIADARCVTRSTVHSQRRDARKVFGIKKKEDLKEFLEELIWKK